MTAVKTDPKRSAGRAAVASGPAAALAGPEPARERLLRTALERFAQQGFAKTSTREIAEAAQVNVASIAYYFGDKAGLYRAVFFELQSAPEEEIQRFGGAQLSLRDALRGLYIGLIEPLKQGELTTLCMKLHMREMIEPTGLWDALIEHEIRPNHQALVAQLCRHLGRRAPDADIERLAVSIIGLAIHLHLGRDVIDTIAPTLNATPASIAAWLDRLVMYAMAMVEAEQRRRAPPARKKKTP